MGGWGGGGAGMVWRVHGGGGDKSRTLKRGMKVIQRTLEGLKEAEHENED